jgi:hypothetical protein
MRDVYANKNNYISFTPEVYESFSADSKSKYEWIHQPETGGAHFGCKELYWRLKTPEDHAIILSKQEKYVDSIPDGKLITHDQMFNIIFDELPLSLKKQFVIILAKRYNETDRITIRGDEYETNPRDRYSWVRMGVLKSNC